MAVLRPHLHSNKKEGNMTEPEIIRKLIEKLHLEPLTPEGGFFFSLIALRKKFRWRICPSAIPAGGDLAQPFFTC
jgi:hypothetical protein